MSNLTEFSQLNHASTARIRALAARLSDEEMQTRVGDHWTVAIALAHIAFWDRRIMLVLDVTEKTGELYLPGADVVINDLSLPLWAAIPPREAARLAIETCEALDKRMDEYPPALRDVIGAYNERWVARGLHRNEHLNDVDEALAGR